MKIITGHNPSDRLETGSVCVCVCASAKFNACKSIQKSRNWPTGAGPPQSTTLGTKKSRNCRRILRSTARIGGALLHKTVSSDTHTHTHEGWESKSVRSTVPSDGHRGGEFLIFSLETLSFTDRQLIVIGVAVNLSGQNVVVRRRIIIGRYIYIDCRVIYLERNE